MSSESLPSSSVPSVVRRYFDRDMAEAEVAPFAGGAAAVF
jgi:hypothetical protein